MRKFCSECGSELTGGGKFCGNCGATIPTANSTPREPGHSSAAAIPQGAVAVASAPSIRRSYLDPPPGHQATSSPQFAAATAPSAPIAGLWKLQIDLQPRADRACEIASKWAPPGSTFANPVRRMVRAAFLDANTFQETTSDSNATTEAGVCALIPLVAVAVGPAILGMLVGQVALNWLFIQVAFQAVSLAGFVAGAAYSASFIIGRKVDPLSLFRPIAYAQSAGVLGFIPIIGSILSLWRIVTTLAAIKDSVGCDTGKAIALLIVGAISGSIATAIIYPVLIKSMGAF